MIDLKNKKVTVMGLGLYKNGSGIAATKFLLAQGAKVTVTDLKTKQQLAEPIKRLGAGVKKINPHTFFRVTKTRGKNLYKTNSSRRRVDGAFWKGVGIKFVLGEHRLQDFKTADLVIRNPGVPNNSAFLIMARKNNIPVETDISLFFKLINRKRVIGITGTRGKSTTTSLVYEIIKNIDKTAVLGGNISNSPLAQMAQVQKGGPVVLELSSWMLESLAESKISPYISVVTNIYPDHLNTYKNITDYAAAKENIWRWQNSQDIVILNRDNNFTQRMGRQVPGRRYWFSLKKFKEENGIFVSGGYIYFRDAGQEQKIMAVKNIKLLGEHNLSNVLAAIGVGMVFGVSPEKIRQVVANFNGISDRLEFLREVGGVKYYNDTTSTTPEATMAALRALAGQKITNSKLQISNKFKIKNSKLKIILIAGGSDKGLDFEELTKKIYEHCRILVLLKGTGSERLKKYFINSKFKIQNSKFVMLEVDSMFSAVEIARGLARFGDIILLSPACASFGMFINEFDRGEQFRNIVSKF